MLHFINSSLPFLFTIFGLYIAYQQLKINKQLKNISSQQLKVEIQKVKWELFEKRFKIYNDTKNHLASLLQNRVIGQTESHKYIYNVRESAFLFDKDTNEYIQKIIVDGIDYSESVTEMDSIKSITLTKEELYELNEKIKKHKVFFRFEFTENIEKRFMKYLDFQNLT